MSLPRAIPLKREYACISGRDVPEISGIHHLALAGFGAASWVGLEWLRGWFLTGFPWNLLGVSQYKNIALIQMADVTGVYGISFLIVFFNNKIRLAELKSCVQPNEILKNYFLKI